jgi:hypothetical protein
MTRRIRTWSAALAALALVFAQFVVSAHACQGREAPARSPAAVHHEGCGGDPVVDPAPANGNLCQQHCQYGDASLDGAQPDLPVADFAGPALRVVLGEPVLRTADGRPSWRRAQAAPPPPAILFGVLRI